MSNNSNKIISINRKARFLYEILFTLEAGIELKGSEVKSLRLSRCSIVEAFVQIKNNEAFVINLHIPKYDNAFYTNHDELRQKRLLLHKKEINKLKSLTAQKGYTITVLQLYFKKGKAKLEIGVAKGKSLIDKRQTIKARDWRREQGKILKQYTNKNM